MNLQVEGVASQASVVESSDVMQQLDLSLDLRTDHSIGRVLLLRAVAELLADSAKFDWRFTLTREPTRWHGDEHAVALCVRADTPRTPIGVALGTLPLGLYGSPDYLQRCGRVELPSWFAGRRVMDIDFGQPQREWELRAGLARIDTRVPADTTVTAAIHEAVRFAVSGRGLAWLPTLVVTDELRRGLLQPALAGAWRRQSIALHLCLPHRRKPRPDALRVAERLARLLGRPDDR